MHVNPLLLLALGALAWAAVTVLGLRPWTPALIGLVGLWAVHTALT